MSEPLDGEYAHLEPFAQVCADRLHELGLPDRLDQLELEEARILLSAIISGFMEGKLMVVRDLPNGSKHTTLFIDKTPALVLIINYTE